MASDRHRDPGVTVWDLGPTEADPWLVECPRCGRRAVRIARSAAGCPGG